MQPKMQPRAHAWFNPDMLVGAMAMGYRLDAVLGFGGFGAVYLTTGPEGNALAVKVLYPPHSTSTEDMHTWASRGARFLREVQIVSRFDHPNIIKIYDTGYLHWTFSDTDAARMARSDRSGEYVLPFYVTEYIPDGVDRRLASGGPLAATGAVQIAGEVCAALVVLHGADPPVLHRDLNPGNIRLRPDGRAVVTDFGVSRNMGAPSYVTQDGQVIPPGVAAPEQLAGEEPDVRTDIYQVGALLLLMLTGRFPRQGDPGALLTESVAPRAVARVVLRCLAYKKEDRFQDASSLQAALASAKLTGAWKFPMWIAAFVRRVFGRVDHGIFGRAPPLVRRPAWILLSGAVVALAFILWPDPPPPIDITIASSSTKKEWLNRAVEEFNEASRKRRELQAGRRPISVQIVLEEIEPGVWDHYRSGTLVEDILAGEIAPTIASPAEEWWTERLRSKWVDEERAPLTGPNSPASLRTPLAIAMWRSRAEALGCWPIPVDTCTWQHLLDLSKEPDAWATLGHPEWGSLKLGMGLVGKSNSATLTVALVCMTGLKGRGEFGLESIQPQNGCGDAIRSFSSAVVLYLQKSEWALDEMRKQGPGFVDGVPTYEAEVIELNEEWRAALPEPIVAAYPQDFSVVVTHPLAILDGAPWVTQDQARAAEIFKGFLLGADQQGRLVAHGLRPADPGAQLGPPIEPKFGVNPGANLVSVPLPPVQDRIVDVWLTIRTGQ